MRDANILKMATDQHIQINELNGLTALTESKTKGIPYDPNYPVYRKDWKASDWLGPYSLWYVPTVNIDGQWINASYSDVLQNKSQNYRADRIYLLFGTLQTDEEVTSYNFSYQIRSNGEVLPVLGKVGAISLKYIQTITQGGFEVGEHTTRLNVNGFKIWIDYRVCGENQVHISNMGIYEQGAFTPKSKTEIGEYSANNTFWIPKWTEKFYIGRQYSLPLFMTFYVKQ